MKRRLWVEEGKPPTKLVAALDRLLAESEDWAEWCTAVDVMDHLSKHQSCSGFFWVQGSIGRRDCARVPASWLEWGRWSIITTAQWIFVYPTNLWCRAAQAQVSLRLSQEELERLRAQETLGG